MVTMKAKWRGQVKQVDHWIGFWEDVEIE